MKIGHTLRDFPMTSTDLAALFTSAKTPALPATHAPAMQPPQAAAGCPTPEEIAERAAVIREEWKGKRGHEARPREVKVYKVHSFR